MPSILTLVAIVGLLLFLRYPYRLARNFYYAKRSGIPYVVIPYDQNAFVWVILSVPVRKPLKKLLPPWLFNRIAITIWGWEFHERHRPWKKYAAGAADPRTMAWVTAGTFEINSWDPEFAMEVLKRPRDFVQPHFTKVFVGRFGHNVLTLDGDKWARHRKVLAQVINERISKSIFEETIKQTTGLLDEVTDGGKENSVDTLGIFDMMKKITIHVLSGAGMGQPVAWDTSLDNPKEGYNTTFMSSAKTIMDGMAGPIALPSWLLDNYPSFLPGHGYVKRLGYAVHEYPIHTRQILHEEREKQAADSEVKTNVISQLVQAARVDKTGQALTEDEMVGNLFVFTAAGFETTANTLSYALACLARQPKWQDWVFEEIDAILPKDAPPADYTALFPKATRIMAVMLETLRLYTPLVHITKQSNFEKEQIIVTSKHTYRIPPGTQTYISAIGLHLEPSVWRDINKTDDDIKNAPSEPDEEVFRPTRWIVQNGQEQTLFRPPPGNYIPWSAGPRNCPGTKMAQVEFVATFLTLFQTHRIAAVPLQVPQTGAPGLGMRDETPEEVEQRMDNKIKESLAILTLQLDGVYDATKPGNEAKGIKIRLSKRK